MTDDFYISLQTRKKMDSNEAIESLVRSWRDLDRRDLRPEFFSDGEPVRRSLSGKGAEEAILLWKNRNVPLMFRRASQPKFLTDIANAQDAARFPWTCTVWLDNSAADEAVTYLFKFLIHQFEPGFAFVSKESDVNSKHFFRYKKKIGKLELNAEKFFGIEMTDKFPGIYWRTYFGSECSQLVQDLIGGTLPPDSSVRNFHGGNLLETYVPSSLIGTEEAIRTENYLIDLVGREKFFIRGIFDPT